jgi:radical SAM protein with 4Fe4S-binding SPASM domain
MSKSRYLIDRLYSLRFVKRFLEYSIFRRVSFPFEFQIQTTNFCNSSCVMCPNAQNKPKKMEFMTNQIFLKIIQEIITESQSPYIYLHLQNEPLTDKDIFNKISYVKAQKHKKIITQIITNGSLLTEKRIKELEKSENDILVISLDSLSKETYEKVRPGLNYTEVINNIDNVLLSNYKKDVFVGFVIQKENFNEIKEFKKYWKQKGARPLITVITNRSGDLKNFEQMRIPNSNIPFSEKVVGAFFRKIIRCCPNVLTSFNILSNGDVILCCSDYTHKVILGNIYDSSIKEIWASKKYQDIREILYRGDFKNITVCRNCSNYYNM